MFLRLLILCVGTLFSISSVGNSLSIDLGHLEKLPAGCSLQSDHLDCQTEAIVLRSSVSTALNIKAAKIEIQGTIEAEDLTLEASDITVAPGASLLLKNKSSFHARSQIAVHGGLFASDLEISSSAVKFEKTADVQVRKLKMDTFYFSNAGRSIFESFRITLNNQFKLNQLSFPVAEFDGNTRAKLLTVQGPAVGSRFAVAKSGVVNVKQILIVTKGYLNLGHMRFATLKINGIDHAAYGQTSGVAYEAFAHQVKSHEGAMYDVNDATVWGPDCVDQAKWNVKNALGFYCLTLTAGEHSTWRANTVDLTGDRFILSNTLIANELNAQLKTLYTTDRSVQKIAKAKVFAKHLLLDGSWTGNEAQFAGDVVFFGPHSNIDIKNLEVVIRNGGAASIRDILNRTSRSQFAVVETIFKQLLEQEEAFNQALEKSANDGDFQLTRRWKMRQFRNRIRDSFKAQNAIQAAHDLAHSAVELDLYGAVGVAPEEFTDLRQFVFANQTAATTFPALVLGAINSHNLKLRTDGSVFLSQSSKLDVSKLLNINARNHIFANGLVRGRLVELFAQSFVLAEDAALNASDRNAIHAGQRMLLNGLLTSDHDNVLVVKDGDVLLGKSAQVKSGACTTIDAKTFFHSGTFDGGCLRINAQKQVVLNAESKVHASHQATVKSEGSLQVSGDVHARVVDMTANDFRLAKFGTVNAAELATVNGILQVIVDGLIHSDGNILLSSDGAVDVSESANVRAKDTLSIKAQTFLHRGTIAASQVAIGVQQLTTFANSKIEAPSIDIRAVSAQLAGILASDRLVIDVSGKLKILSDADIHAKETAYIKSENIEISGKIRSKIVEVFAQNIELLEGSKLTAEERLLVKADLQLKVAGLLKSDGALRVEGDRIYFDSTATVSAAALAHIKAKHLEASGSLEAKDLSVVTDVLRTASTSLIKGENVNFDVVEADLYGIINSKSLVINAKNRLVLRSTSKIEASGSAALSSKNLMELSGEVRAQVVDLFAKDLVLLKSGKVSAEQILAIQAGLKANLDGLLESKGNVVIVAGTLTLSQSGKIDSAQIASIKADHLFSKGVIAGAASLIVDVDKDFNNAGSLQGGKVAVTANGTFANGGTITAADQLYIKVSAAVTAKELGATKSGGWTTLQGEFGSDDVLTLLEGNDGQMDVTGLRVVTNQPVVINRHVATSFDSELYAASLELEENKKWDSNGDIGLHVGSLHAKAGSELNAKGSIDIDAEGDVVQEAARDQDGKVRVSEITSRHGISVKTKGRYVNQGSILLAKETLVIQAEGGVVIVPLIWVETRKETKKGFLTKTTTIINEEKQQQAMLGGTRIKVDASVDSTVTNVKWEGRKELGEHISEERRELKVDETRYKEFTGAGKVVMTAATAAATVAGSVAGGPAGTFIASVAMSYIQSQMLNQRFDTNGALKQAAVATAASGIGTAAGSAAGGVVGGSASTVGSMAAGAAQGVTTHVAQECLSGNCKKMNVDQVGRAAVTGGLGGAAISGAQGSVLEDATKLAGVAFGVDAGYQAAQGRPVNWEKSGESGLNAGVGYASGRVTKEALQPDSPLPKPKLVVEDASDSQSDAHSDLQSDSRPAVPKEGRTRPAPPEPERDRPAVLKQGRTRPAPPEAERIRPSAPRVAEQKGAFPPVTVDAPPGPAASAGPNRLETTLDDLRETVEDVAESVCFKAGTRVRTEAGWDAIESLTAGDTVVSCDLDGERCVYQPIVQVMESETSVIMHLQVGGETIDVTPNHPVYIADRETFVPVGQLKIGDTILALNGDRMRVDGLVRETLATPISVYNLEVGGTHNYYVSAADGDPQDLLVHNCDTVKAVGAHAKEFGAGVVVGVLESASGDLTSKHGNRVFEHGRFTGKIAGSVGQMGIGAIGAAGSGGAGIVACASGVACAMAPAAALVTRTSLVVATHGYVVLAETLNAGPQTPSVYQQEKAGSPPSKRHTPDQQAVVDLAKDAEKRRGSVTNEEADTLVEWGKEVGFDEEIARGPESHPDRKFGKYKHIHIGPVNHLPVKERRVC